MAWRYALPRAVAAVELHTAATPPPRWAARAPLSYELRRWDIVLERFVAVCSAPLAHAAAGCSLAPDGAGGSAWEWRLVVSGAAALPDGASILERLAVDSCDDSADLPSLLLRAELPSVVLALASDAVAQQERDLLHASARRARLRWAVSPRRSQLRLALRLACDVLDPADLSLEPLLADAPCELLVASPRTQIELRSAGASVHVGPAALRLGCYLAHALRDDSALAPPAPSRAPSPAAGTRGGHRRRRARVRLPRARGDHPAQRDEPRPRLHRRPSEEWQGRRDRRRRRPCREGGRAAGGRGSAAAVGARHRVVCGGGQCAAAAPRVRRLALVGTRRDAFRGPAVARRRPGRRLRVAVGSRRGRRLAPCGDAAHEPPPRQHARHPLVIELGEGAAAGGAAPSAAATRGGGALLLGSRATRRAHTLRVRGADGGVLSSPLPVPLPPLDAGARGGGRRGAG